MGHRKESETSERRLLARLREAEAVKLRIAGLDYAAIGRQLKPPCTKSSACKMVKRVLMRLAAATSEDALLLIELEKARLDRIQAGLWTRAASGHEGAIDRVLKIQERRARLLGLDAPAKQKIDADINARIDGDMRAQVHVYLPDNGRQPTAQVAQPEPEQAEQKPGE
jgi:hypothetical protein